MPGCLITWSSFLRTRRISIDILYMYIYIAKVLNLFVFTAIVLLLLCIDMQIMYNEVFQLSPIKVDSKTRVSSYSTKSLTYFYVDDI